MPGETRPSIKWLSGKDSNLDQSLQRALCYLYTTRQAVGKFTREKRVRNKIVIKNKEKKTLNELDITQVIVV